MDVLFEALNRNDCRFDVRRLRIVKPAYILDATKIFEAVRHPFEGTQCLFDVVLRESKYTRCRISRSSIFLVMCTEDVRHLYRERHIKFNSMLTWLQESKALRVLLVDQGMAVWFQ